MPALVYVLDGLQCKQRNNRPYVEIPLGDHVNKSNSGMRAKVLGTESSMSLLLQGTKVPGSESSWERKFHLWNFRSRERKYVGMKVS